MGPAERDAIETSFGQQCTPPKVTVWQHFNCAPSCTTTFTANRIHLTYHLFVRFRGTGGWHPISSLKPFLKRSSLFGHRRPTHFFIPPRIHSPFFSARPHVSCHIHHCMVHSVNMYGTFLNFSHSFCTLSTSPPLHTSYFPRKISWYALSFTILFSSLTFQHISYMHPPSNFS